MDPNRDSDPTGIAAGEGGPAAGPARCERPPSMASFASLPPKGIPPRPPDKGSFPLDHFGECTAAKKAYMDCLKEHQGQSEECRRLSAAYLQCRMDSKLMAKEELGRLGYDKSALEEPKHAEARSDAAATAAAQTAEPVLGRAGFIAGLRPKG